MGLGGSWRCGELKGGSLGARPATTTAGDVRRRPGVPRWCWGRGQRGGFWTGFCPEVSWGLGESVGVVSRANLAVRLAGGERWRTWPARRRRTRGYGPPNAARVSPLGSSEHRESNGLGLEGDPATNLAGDEPWRRLGAAAVELRKRDGIEPWRHLTSYP